jgi:2-polyprenyl-6-methoxyphenol hydroxylase-like FAD-dependent oxidoreductase
MNVLIAGAGLGGLVAALKLHRLGMRVIVADSAKELLPLGVGINMLPHGAAILYELGLEEGLKRTGVQTRAVEYRTQYGQLILRDPRGLHAGVPWPQYSIHRGQLHKLLLDAALAELGTNSILTGHRFERFAQNGDTVTAFFRRSDDSIVELEANLLIGADGTHSAVCNQLHVEPLPLVFSGTMMWRGALEREPYLDGETMVVAGHHDSKMVIYPISEEARQRGKSLVNMTAEINIGKDKTYPREDWNRRAEVNEFIHAFEGWKFDFMDIPATLRETKNIFVYPMVDRDALPFWSQNRVTLLGDAAHPMYPIGANGASQAFLDADALGSAFAETKDPVEALLIYESRRLPATAKVVAANRSKGPEAVLQLARERIKGPDDDVRALISQEEIDAITVKYQQVAGFDANTLQKRADAQKELGLQSRS